MGAEVDLAVPGFLPGDQKAYLQDLIDKTKTITHEDKRSKSLFAVGTIEVIEHFHQGKGQEVLRGAHILTATHEAHNRIVAAAQTRHRISSHYQDKKNCRNWSGFAR